MMADLPSLQHGKVVGRFLANIADGSDIDDLPEFPPLSGTITFTASPRKILVYGADPAATVVQLPDHYVASLDEFGYLTWRGQRGIRLISPETGTNPADWTWRVSFALRYEDRAVAIAPYSIEVPPYTPGPDEEDPDEDSTGLVDLTLASPVPGSEGDAVVRGLSVVDVDLVGDALVFKLDNGDELDPVTVPQIEAATQAKNDAVEAKEDAEQAKADAEAARDAFDLSIGTVTTGDPGDPAEITITGPGPAYVIDAVLPQGEQGPQGVPAPDADATTKGILQLTGDLGGTAASPTVPGLANKANASHTHPAADISNATTIGRSVLTAADGPAIRTLIGAGTSSLALGTTGSTAAAGNDSRLSDTRTPTTGTVPYDICYVAVGKNSTRAATSYGDMPMGLKLQRAVTFSSVTYRVNTADASGNLVVELRKNGSAVSGSSATIASGSQVAGATATGTFTFVAGDILTVYMTSVGTTPGTGLVADIKGLA